MRKYLIFNALFNIRDAAAGVEDGWQRTEFTFEAASLLINGRGRPLSP